jgi:hypothetical protein
VTAPQEPYVDETGHPQLRDSIVAFFDILGFSESSNSCATPDDAQHLLDRIVSAIKDSRTFVRSALGAEQSTGSQSWAIKFFSDNLALGYPLNGSGADAGVVASVLIGCAQRYQLRMALNGFFLRGALTRGPICLTDEVIFGPALIESYQLESKASIVPRVLVAESITTLIDRCFHSSSNSADSQEQDAICRDVDGRWFVNYLQAARELSGFNWDYLERHKQSVLSCLASTTRHEVLPKFGWACRYHNVFCHWHRDEPGYSDRFRIDRLDEQSTITRLSDATERAAGAI